MTKARPPTGILDSVNERFLRCFEAYFNMKIHLHVVLAAMTPPMRGPMAKDIVDTSAIKAVVFGSTEGDTASDRIEIGSVKTPAADNP